MIAQYVPLTSLSQFSVDNKAKILVNDGRAYVGGWCRRDGNWGDV